MYLVHVSLVSGDPDAATNGDVVTSLAARVAASVAVEHVTTHAVDDRLVVFGVFVRSPILEQAEAVAESAVRRSLESDHRCAGWAVVDYQVPLLPAFFEWWPTGPETK